MVSVSLPSVHATSTVSAGTCETYVPVSFVASDAARMTRRVVSGASGFLPNVVSPSTSTFLTLPSASRAKVMKLGTMLLAFHFARKVSKCQCSRVPSNTVPYFTCRDGTGEAGRVTTTSPYIESAYTPAYFDKSSDGFV